MDPLPFSEDQIRQMITLLSTMLPKEANTETVAETSSSTSVAPKTTKKKTKRSFGKSKPSNATQNLFDTMMESRMHKEDVEIDKKLSRNEPSPRLRKYTPIKVRCRVCGKSESINPSILTDSPDRYKCNKCAKEPG